MPVPCPDGLHQLGDGLRLIATRMKFGIELEDGHALSLRRHGFAVKEWSWRSA
jgi:hypothetical protein